MKKFLQATLFSCLFVSVSFAQMQYKIGGRIGKNVSTYEIKYSSEVPDSDRRQFDKSQLPSFGISFEMGFSKDFALQTELNFSQKGYGFSYDRTTVLDTISTYLYGNYYFITDWLELPILAKLNYSPIQHLTFSFLVGPSVSYHLGFRSRSNLRYIIKINGIEQIEPDVSRKWADIDTRSRFDIAINFGGEVNYYGFFLDSRYQLGHIDMRNQLNAPNTGIAQLHTYTRNLAFSMGYRTALNRLKK
jgi:Outer membrane protein beta-barrel domain